MATRTRKKEPVVKDPAPPAAAPPAEFSCAVCQKKRPCVKDGAAQFFAAKNEGKICISCLATRDAAELAKGGVTMTLVRDGDVWWAVGRGGKLRFRLVRDPGQTDAQVVSLPRFLDRDKNLWSGRLYPRSGLAYFQRKEAKPVRPAPAPA